MTSKGILEGTNKCSSLSKECYLANMLISLSGALAVMLLMTAIKEKKLHVPACLPCFMHCGILSTQSLVRLPFSPFVSLLSTSWPSCSCFSWGFPPSRPLNHLFHCSLRFELYPYRHSQSIFYVHQLCSVIRCIKPLWASLTFLFWLFLS